MNVALLRAILPALPPGGLMSVTDKELKKLKRADLLEMLLDVTKEAEELKAKLAEAEAKLAQRDIAINTSGSVAEAALKLNGVFEAAQRAADQYLENVMHKAPGEGCQGE